jgi:hypothetical protein
MAISFSGGGSRSTRREPPTLGKQLVNCITCGCESSEHFFVIYKAGRKPTPYCSWLLPFNLSVVISWLLPFNLSVVIGWLLPINLSVVIGWLLPINLSEVIGWLLPINLSEVIGWLLPINLSTPYW